MWKEDSQLTTALSERHVPIVEPAGRAPTKHSDGAKLTEIPKPPPSLPRYICESCGDRARVQILAGYLAGKPDMRHFCIECAHAAPLNARGETSAKTRLHLASLVGLTGCLLATLLVLDEWLAPPHITAGFGWHKEAGLALGALLLILGALLRGDLIMLGGLFVFAIAMIAGLFGLTQTPGLGWKDQTLIAVATSCALLSLAASRARRRSSTDDLARPPTASKRTSEPAPGI